MTRLRRENMALDLDYKTKSKTMIIWSWIHFFTVFCRTQGPRRIMKIWPWTLIQGPRLWKYDLGLWLEAVIHIFMATCRSQGPKMTMNILSWTLHQILGLRPYFHSLGPQVWIQGYIFIFSLSLEHVDLVLTHTCSSYGFWSWLQHCTKLKVIFYNI